MEKNKQFYKVMIKLMKQLNIIETEYITKKQMKILLDILLKII